MFCYIFLWCFLPLNSNIIGCSWNHQASAESHHRICFFVSLQDVSKLLIGFLCVLPGNFLRQTYSKLTTNKQKVKFSSRVTFPCCVDNIANNISSHLNTTHGFNNNIYDKLKPQSNIPWILDMFYRMFIDAPCVFFDFPRWSLRKSRPWPNFTCLLLPWFDWEKKHVKQHVCPFLDLDVRFQTWESGSGHVFVLHRFWNWNQNSGFRRPGTNILEKLPSTCFS